MPVPQSMIDDLAGIGGKPEPDEEVETNEDEQEDANEESVIKDLIEELEKFDIILPPDTNEDNFFERLQVGLKTAAAHQGLDDQGENAKLDNETTIADAGGVAMMSLQVKGMLGYAERQHRDAVEATLESLLRSGRCTPPEFHERKQLVPTLRLSLDETGSPTPTDVEKWIASRQPLPRGTFWEPEQRTQRMAAEVEEPPEERTGKESDSKVNAVLAAVFGQRK
jgi:hypothetical protein